MKLNRREFFAAVAGGLAAAKAAPAVLDVRRAPRYDVADGGAFNIRVVTTYNTDGSAYTRYDLLAAWHEQTEWNARLTAELETLELAPQIGE